MLFLQHYILRWLLKKKVLKENIHSIYSKELKALNSNKYKLQLHSICSLLLFAFDYEITQ